MKKAVFGVVLFILFVVVAYLFWSDFGLIKKFTGNNAPELKETEIGGDLSFLNLPDGFKISVVAENFDGPRVILFDAKGRMLVSETKAGRVSVLDPSATDSFENKRVLIDGLKSPHGLDFYTDPKTKMTYLYIAETHQVARYPYDVKTGKITDKIGANIANLPADGNHFTRAIAFGPNYRKEPIVQGQSANTFSATKLYISVGSSCDTCTENTWKRAAILESDPEGTYTAEFAGGLRNSVFFAFHPLTKEIWATEMGRDNLGDNLPPDEINIVKVAGPEDKFGAKRFGWPFCYGNKVRDKKFNPDEWERIDVTDDCGKTEAPVIEIQAHSAPLGLAFVPSGKGWPKEWGGDLLVALHGSWNRSEPVGYKIVRYDLDASGKVFSSEPKDFVSGWLPTNNQKLVTKNQFYGRPVDLKFGPDGMLYVSDDTVGVVYRINLEK